MFIGLSEFAKKMLIIMNSEFFVNIEISHSFEKNQNHDATYRM